MLTYAENKEKTPWGQGGSEKQPCGVLTDGMLPRLIRILEAINFSLIQNAEQKIVVSKIFVCMRPSATSVCGLELLVDEALSY